MKSSPNNSLHIKFISFRVPYPIKIINNEIEAKISVDNKMKNNVLIRVDKFYRAFHLPNSELDRATRVCVITTVLALYT